MKTFILQDILNTSGRGGGGSVVFNVTFGGRVGCIIDLFMWRGLWNTSYLTGLRGWSRDFWRLVIFCRFWVWKFTEMWFEGRESGGGGGYKTCLRGSDFVPILSLVKYPPFMCKVLCAMQLSRWCFKNVHNPLTRTWLPRPPSVLKGLVGWADAHITYMC